MISRSLRKNGNVKCYNCGKQDHLKRDCRHSIPGNNVILKVIHSEYPSLLDYAEDVAKPGTGLMNVGQRGILKVIFFAIGKLHEGPLIGPYVSCHL